jgi:hypothetical protein
MRSPIRMSWVRAVCASMATSPPPSGARPLRNTLVSSAALSMVDMPRVGAPVVVIAWPCLSTIWATPVTCPAAAATPGTLRTVLSSDSGMG